MDIYLTGSNCDFKNPVKYFQRCREILQNKFTICEPRKYMRKRLKSRRSAYQRMLKGLETRAVRVRKNSVEDKTHPWFLYILECRGGSFYTGITTDIQRRLKMHNEGKGARFTRSRRPVKVIYQESLSSRAQALIREYKIKALPRIKKQALVDALSA